MLQFLVLAGNVRSLLGWNATMRNVRKNNSRKEVKLNTKCLLVRMIVLWISACAPSAPTNPADRFAGTWSGTMSFSDDPNRKEDIIVIIRAGCTTGSICGDLNNTTVNCQWEMTLGAVHRDVFEYKFSKTLSGECPALGDGTLTMQSAGTLLREHKTLDFTANGILTQK